MIKYNNLIFLFVLLFSFQLLSSCGVMHKLHTRDEVCIDPVTHKEFSNLHHNNTSTVSPLPTKRETLLQKKYSELLKVNNEQLPNIKMLAFVDEWSGVPYKYGGHTKSGIDCSSFTVRLYQDVYNTNIAGSSGQLKQECANIKKSDLQEGDLLFFKIRRGHISHVGVYLTNNYFVHASTKIGVTISNLNEDYYKRYYSCAGRPKKYYE